ncbi:MAG: hypothetical protein PVJ81_02070 [Dehalococcoidia bacterium]
MIPALSAMALSSDCRRAPALVPTSLKPPLTRITPFTPLAAHSSTADKASSAGMTTMAKSTSPGTALSEG